MRTSPQCLTIVAAMAQNRVIGNANRLPWHLPADLAHFKRLTLGKPMIMGRKTWESLPGLLPGRPHIVVSRNPAYRAEGAHLVNSLPAALTMVAAVDEAIIIGGADLYAQALPLADRLHLTLVQAEVAGDAWFPAFDPADWGLVEREDHPADARNPLPYSFLHYRRQDR